MRNESDTERDPGEARRALRHSQLSRAGATLAVICVLTTICVGTLGSQLHTQSQRNRTVLALGSMGAILMLCQLLGYFRKQDPEEVLMFYRNPHFWGFALACTAVATFLALPLTHPLGLPTPMVVRARTLPPPPPPQAPEPAPEVTPDPVKEPTFPPLRLTGILLNGRRSTALINGDTVMVGESIKGVKLTEVSEAGMIVEMNGVKHCYVLAKGAAREAKTR